MSPLVFPSPPPEPPSAPRSLLAEALSEPPPPPPVAENVVKPDPEIDEFVPFEPLKFSLEAPLPPAPTIIVYEVFRVSVDVEVLKPPAPPPPPSLPPPPPPATTS